jgi:hypothetical protein
MSIQNGDEVYIVGQIRAICAPIEGWPDDQPQVWEFVGVFATKEQAVAACRDCSYFVGGPIKMGDIAPHETSPDWCEMFFPIERTVEFGLLPGEEWPVVEPIEPSSGILR